MTPPIVTQGVAEIARDAWEPCWIARRLANGYPARHDLPSRQACVPTSCALRRALMGVVPEYRWHVMGGRPTKRTPLGGYRDEEGKPQPHCRVEGRRRGPVVTVDITADQFGGPPVIVAEGGSDRHVANMTPRLVREYDACERETVE